MRILVASPFLPHPEATHGGAVYLGSFLAGLTQHAEVGLVSFLRPSEIRWQSQPTQGLAFSQAITLPQRYDLSRRQMLVHHARMLWRWGAQGKPLVAAKFWTPAMADLLRRVGQRFRPDVVLVEFSIMAQYLDALQDWPTVLTDHEHGQGGSTAIAGTNMGRARDRRLWLQYVRAHYPKATLVQALTEPDAERLQQVLGRPVGVRPPVVLLPAVPVDPGSAPARAVFLGDYTHHPNPETATFLARELWPRVRRKSPQAELLLAGPRASGDVKSLGDLPGIRFVGYVQDLRDLFTQARCLVAPAFSGAGSRIKVFTALGYGIPVIANGLGLRGVSAPEGAVRRHEELESLTRSTVELLQHADIAARDGRTARQWALAHLSPSQAAAAQIATIQAALPTR